jgi:two-component system KDP operon response regulator KdpE
LTGDRLSVLWIGSGEPNNTTPSSAPRDGCVVVHARPADAPKIISAISADVIAIEESPLTSQSLALCSRLVRMARMPVVIVSKTADEESMLRAYRADAADYLLLPLPPEELRARLAATARRHCSVRPRIAEESCLTIGGLKVYPKERRVSLGKRQLQLTTMEFDLLLCLARAAGNPVSHKELLETVWGADYSNCRHYLRLYIRYLRAKIETKPDQPKLIINEWGIGYRLSAPAPERAAKLTVF